MITRNQNLPTGSCFLFGPRGTGKTQWLKAEYPDSIYVDLLDSAVHNRLLAHPERLRDFIPPNYAGTVIVDEVQKVPDLLNEVHRLIESTKIRFILTGSSARKLRQRGVNLLAGRALTRHMHPLTAVELGERFDLHKSLASGHLPTLYDSRRSVEPNEYLNAYIQTYLKEEVIQEGLTRNAGDFARFLETASFSQGETLNISSVARDCGIGRKTAESYFDIVEDLLIARRIPIFQKRAKRRITRHPKFYFFDVGIYRTIRPRGPLDAPNEIDGAALETLVLQELLAWIEYERLSLKAYYWRTTDQKEVDFVLYGEEGLIAIEVKRSARVTAEMLKSLKAFREDYPMATCILLNCGSETHYPDGITIMPVEKALQQPGILLGKAAAS